MGYSCTQLADNTLRDITAICIKETNAQNTFKFNNSVYMWEIGKEQQDGSITGSIFKFLNEKQIIKHSSFKINSNGDIKTFLRFKKEVA